MKYFGLIAISLLILSCNNSDEPLKGPEHLQFSLDESILVSRLKGIDSADVNAVSYTHLTLPTICSV